MEDPSNQRTALHSAQLCCQPTWHLTVATALCFCHVPVMCADGLRELVARQGVAVLDGGLATQLEEHGVAATTALWSAEALVNAPEQVTRAHAAFVGAGADVATCASYQASIPGLVKHGRMSGARAEHVLASAVSVARDAGPRLVAASLGPYGAVRADGSEYTGVYGDGMTEDKLFRWHRERFDVLAAAKPDIMAFETIPRIDEARVAMRLVVAQNAASWLPATLSFCCRDDRHLSSGERVFDAVVAAVCESIAHAGPPRLHAIGVNCVPPQHVASLLREISAALDYVMPSSACALRPLLMAYPNSGETWDEVQRVWLPQHRVVDWTPLVRQWYQLGARVIGGCCRTSPRDIAQMRRALLPGSGACL